MNVLIAEDEEPTSELLKELIEANPKYLVVQTTDSIDSTVKYLDKHQDKIDLLFFDIQLADGESFEIFKQISISKPVVFCTAYNEHMLNAFKNNGIDYIMKPVLDEDIDNALQKFEKLTSTTVNGANNLKHDFQKAFIVHFRDKMIPISVSNIAFIRLSDEIVHIYNSKGEKHVIFKTLGEIEEVLDSNQFFRINRQMIVNRDAIKEIIPYFNRKVAVEFNFPIPERAIVSRLKVTPFMQWVEM